MRVNVAIPEPHVSAPVLDAALEAVTRLDESMIRRGELPLFDPEHPQARWKPEPPGQEHFDHGRLVIGRGWGDCDDLSPWHAASLRATGEDPRAKARVRRSGPKRWHARVVRADGSVDDPSRWAGMAGGKPRGVVGAAQPMMLVGSSNVVGGSVGSYINRPQLAIRPVVEPGGRIESWQARTDLPWHARGGTSPADIAMVSLHRSPASDQALVGAIEGAILLGECNGNVDEDHLERLRCLSDMVQGASWEECAREYGPEHATAAGAVVGRLFKVRLGKGLKRFGKGLGKVLKKVAPTAASFIPGVGPVASAALRAMSHPLKKSLAREQHLPPAQRMSPVTVNVYTGSGRKTVSPGVAAVEP